jgi:hypothetical protein
MIDGAVKYVLCLTCNSKHLYHAPEVAVASKKTPAPAAAKVKSSTRVAKESKETKVTKETKEVKETKAAKDSTQTKTSKPAAPKPVKTAAKSVKEKPDKAAKPASPPKSKTVKDTKASSDDGDQVYRQWLELKDSVNTDKPKEYVMEGTYDLNQAINHHTFGLGFVTKVMLPAKIQVTFERTSKVLIMNLNKAKK